MLDLITRIQLTPVYVGLENCHTAPVDAWHLTVLDHWQAQCCMGLLKDSGGARAEMHPGII